MTAKKPSSCVGALIRKPLTWPPRWQKPASEAAQIARSRIWQPQTWTHKRIAS
jgi:hypothetical protein